MAVPDEDKIWRIAVERTCEWLGAERCSIFWLDETTREWVGSYATDVNGKITDVGAYRFSSDSMLHYEKDDAARRWFVEQAGPYVDYVVGKGPAELSRGWVVHTPIFSSKNAIKAIMFNDTFITQAPMNERQQDLIAVFCSMLGNILERKRLEASLQNSNLKLEQRVQRRTQQLARRAESERLVAEIAAQFMRVDAMQIDANIQYAITRTAQFLDVQAARIFFLAEDSRIVTESLEWRAEGIAPNDPPKMTIPFYELYPWWHQQLLKDTAIQIVDLAELPPEMDTFVESSRRQNIKSMVSVPLMRGKDLIGEVGFATIGNERQWTQEDITLIRLVAETVSGAMERARIARALQTERDLLEQRVTERTRELSTLLEMSQSLSATNDLNTLLDRALNSLSQLVPYNYALVWERINTTELRLVDAGQLNLTAEARTIVWSYDEATDLHWKTAFEHGQPIVIGDIRDGSPLAQAYCAQSTRLLGRVPKSISSIMFVPIMSHGRVLGLMGISHGTPYALQERHAQMVMALARQIGTSIDNGRLQQHQMKSAALSERNRLARELHDSVSQALFGIVLGARTLKHHLGVTKREYADAIEYLLKLSEVSLSEMRALIFELRPESLEKFGLIEAFRKQATELCNRHSLKLQIDADEQDPALPLAVKEAIYRVAMEALQNTIKHAQAQTVTVRLKTEMSNVLIEITDDGAGFDPQTSREGRLGLKSMRERATEYGGTISVQSAAGRGTIVQASFPMNMVKSAFY